MKIVAKSPEFRTKKLTQRVTRIFAFSTELMYLVEGDERAALLDTGSGVGDLRACVERLTNKPVIVLLTHGHVDHAMGAVQFDEVYMNRDDDYIYAKHGSMDFRSKCLSLAEPKFIINRDDMLPTPDVSSFRDMKGGDSFDLGGVTVEVYDCPGHTKGSVVFLIREERALLLGDACNTLTFMFEDYSTSITQYEESLHRLLSQVRGKYDTVYLSHRDGGGHKEMIEDVVKVCEDIRAGNTDDMPYEFLDVKGLAAKAVDKDGKRIDGGKGNIVYNKDRI